MKWQDNLRGVISLLYSYCDREYRDAIFEYNYGYVYGAIKLIDRVKGTHLIEEVIDFSRLFRYAQYDEAKDILMKISRAIYTVKLSKEEIEDMYGYILTLIEYIRVLRLTLSKIDELGNCIGSIDTYLLITENRSEKEIRDIVDAFLDRSYRRYISAIDYLENNIKRNLRHL